jgi:hypothetical protein
MTQIPENGYGTLSLPMTIHNTLLTFKIQISFVCVFFYLKLFFLSRTTTVAVVSSLIVFCTVILCHRHRTLTTMCTFSTHKTYNIIYKFHTTYSRVLLEKLTGPQLVKKFLTFYGTRWFIAAVTSTSNLSVARSM